MPDINGLLTGVSPGAVDLADVLLGPHNQLNSFAYFHPRAFTDTTVSSVGMTMASYSGVTATAGNSYSEAGAFFRRPHIRYPSATAAGSSSGARGGTTMVTGNTGEGKGGFRCRFRWGADDAAPVAGARCFAGIYSSGDIGNVEPSSLAQIIGFGCDSSETDLSLLHNDASGTATKIALPGAAGTWPAHGAASEVYEGIVQIWPGRSKAMWQITKWAGDNAPLVARGIITTNIPISGGTGMFGVNIMRNNGATALSVRVAIYAVVIGQLDVYV